MSSNSYYIGRYEGYKKGYLKAKEEYQSQRISYAGDRKAIEDEVWKFVEKLEYLTLSEAEDCFDVEYEGTPFVAGMFSYQEAKAKYEAWKKQKDEICVGDEVNPINDDTWKGVVVNVDNGDLTIMGSRGISSNGYESKYFSKTGRHFDEVEELLKKMRGEE